MNLKTLEWTATAILIVGTAVNSLGLYPWGPMILIFGGLIWLVVAVYWRSTPLIVTNAVMLLTGIVGLLYHYMGFI
jgi:hypothetical protein